MRPCFLVIDREYPTHISTRKLVIETAKLNVITTYSSTEALETFIRFPNVDGIVLDSEVNGEFSCRQLIQKLRAVRPEVPIIVVSPTGYDSCPGEDFRVSGFDPAQLLTKLQQICPKEIQKAIRQDEDSDRA